MPSSSRLATEEGTSPQGLPPQALPSLQDFELLAQISEMLTELDRDRVLERVIALSVDAIGADRASILLHPDYNENWMPSFYKHPSGSEATDRMDVEQSLHFARRVVDQGLAGWVLSHRQGVIIGDTRTDDRWVQFPDGTSSARSALCVPFLLGGQALGALTLLHTQPDYFTEHHLRLMMIVANQTTVAVRDTQLFHQLNEQKRRLEAMLYAMPDLLLILDEQSRIVLVNAATGEFLDEHLALAEFEGQPLARFAENDPAIAQIADVLAQTDTDTPAAFETRSEKQRRDFLVTISGWENPVVKKSGGVVVLRDITQLRDLNRFKDEMLQMASHDLRSPLALIVGYCSLIALDTPEDSPIQEYLNVIQRSTEKMKSLLDDLLRVEQIRNSPLEMNEAIDFAALLQGVIDNITETADSKQHQLSTDIQLDGLPGAMMNPILIREAMENLIQNAIKYTPDGGHIQVSSFIKNERVHFEVQDDGIGIPQNSLPRLFESFYRAKQPGAERIEGRGLGLSLVKTIIERHYGKVWVESESGVGSRFGFWIPLIT